VEPRIRCSLEEALQGGHVPDIYWTMDASSLRARLTQPITRSRGVTPRRCGPSLSLLQQLVVGFNSKVSASLPMSALREGTQLVSRNDLRRRSICEMVRGLCACEFCALGHTCNRPPRQSSSVNMKIVRKRDRAGQGRESSSVFIGVGSRCTMLYSFNEATAGWHRAAVLCRLVRVGPHNTEHRHHNSVASTEDTASTRSKISRVHCTLFVSRPRHTSRQWDNINRHCWPSLSCDI